MAIRGVYWYCFECSKPYPWTSAAIQAARVLAIEAELSEMDRSQLPDIIENLVRDTPRSIVDAGRMKRILENAQPWAAEEFRGILIDVITVSARKILWP